MCFGCKKYPKSQEIHQAWRPPASGFRIKTLPPEIMELANGEKYQKAWAKHGQQEPSGPDPAATEMLGFLKINGFTGPEVVDWVQQEQGRQYCASDPRFCPKEDRSRALGGTKSAPKPTPPSVLAWSRHVWRFANFALGDDVKDPAYRVKFIVDSLTAMISSHHIGCPDCAKHWRQNLADFPIAGIQTLQQAREWLVAIHNAASPHTPPMSLEAVAMESGWTLTGQSVFTGEGALTSISLAAEAA